MITLRRYPEYLGTTPGAFYYKDNLLCYSLELPWLCNEVNISCIPRGIYKLKLTFSPRFKRQLWEVLNVPNRSGIRIHSANIVDELEGCIAPCKHFLIVGDTFFGEFSRVSYTILDTTIKDNGITGITIV